MLKSIKMYDEDEVAEIISDTLTEEKLSFTEPIMEIILKKCYNFP